MRERKQYIVFEIYLERRYSLCFAAWIKIQYLLVLDLKYIEDNGIAKKLLREVGHMLYRMIYPVC